MFTDDQKREFALRYLEYRRDANKAAARVFPYDIAARCAATLDLPFDPLVNEEIDELLAKFGYEHFLPGKHELASRILDVADAATDADDKTKALKLYADVMGFVEKPGTVVNNNLTNTVNRVMVLRDHGTADEWEARLVEQQKRLAHVSAAPIEGERAA